MKDRNGDPFKGTPAELRAWNNTLSQRARRAGNGRLDMLLPPGTEAAMARVCEAAGFEDRRELVAMQIHKLDQLLSAAPEAFEAWVKFSTVPGDLSKYVERIGRYVPPETDDENDP